MKNYYKVGIRPLLVLFLLLLFHSRLEAQVSTYGFMQSTGTYTPISGGTVLGTATNDDTNFPNLPIGFTFTYNGTTYTQFSINTNGFIALGTTVASSYTALSTGGTNNVIAALNRDLQGNTTTGELSYLTIGTAPNQTLVVQWKSYRKFNATGDDYNFQLRLNEGTNTIETVYGTMTNNATAATPQIGLRGAANSDFNNRTTTSNWAATTAGGANNATVTLSSSVFPASGTTFVWTPRPATPGTPVQDPAAPLCSTGTTLTASGTPETNVTWYWQTSAAGTSTATPYTGPYTVFANGTYYLRALNTVANIWSTNASSITVSNFPLATPPPAPVAAQNPACVTTGTSITAAAAPAGYAYYWQGTNASGSSNALDAATAYPVSVTGTYYVAAFETATQCWSNAVGTLVTIDTYIPAAPTSTQTNYNICSGTVSQLIDATPPAGGPGGSVTTSFGTNLVSTGTGAATFTITAPTIPADATITSAQLQFTTVTAVNGSWRSEIRVALSGAYTLGATQLSNLSSAGLISPDPVVNLTGFPLAGGSLNLLITETFDDGGAGTNDATFGEAKLVITYTQNPVSTLAWYDASTAGTVLGTTSPFESVGTSVMPNTSAAGAFTFYAASASGACQSVSRLPIVVNVTEVLADLIPVDVTCNGADNGSFTLGTVQCGTAPFLYSLDSGATFIPIPTDLIAGTYSIIMQDAIGGESAPITVVIAEPGIPTALTVVDVNYFNTSISWTPQGDETQWFIEYGPAGFVPGTGMMDTATGTASWTITGLTEDTDYEFYVSADCGGTNGWAGPVAFSTNAGFYTFDNNCGPGFFDISTTGTNNSLTDDAEVGVTLPFSYSFQGTSYTDITIGNNGGITFGTLTGQIGFGNGAIGGAPVGLYPFWDDIGNNGAGVFYQTIGTAPNQQFIVQWNKEHLGATGNDLVFQLVLDEATNEAYFFYSDVIGGSAAVDYGASATIGASGPVDVSVSQNNTTFLQNNACVHFYSALCPNPINITTQVFSEEVFLNWGAGLYGETEWTLIYGPAGFAPGTGDTLTSNTPDAIIPNLMQLTSYDVIIFSECALDDLTSSGVLVNFTTLPNCSNPSALIGNTAADSLDIAWNWIESDPTYPVTGFNIQYGMTGFSLYDNYDSIAVAGGTNLADTITDAGLIAGGVYDVYVQAVCAGTNDTSSFIGPITVVMPLTNDAVCAAENLNANGTVYTFNNNGATVETNEASIAPPADGAQVTTGWTNSTLNGTTWFTFQAPASGSVRVNNTAINYNGQAAVYSATDCGDFVTFALIAANDNEIGGTSIAPNYTICGLTPGATYYLMHDGFNGATGNYSVSITPIVLEAGTANAVTDICTGEQVELFNTVTGEDAGGVWSSDIAAVNASITGSGFTSEGLAYQVFDFQYRVTDGCAYDSIITQIHVFAPSSAGNDGVITACRNEPIDLLAGLNGNADLTGTWYNPSNVAMPGSDIVTSNIGGQYNYDYIAGNGVCPNDTANVVVTVLASCNYLSLEEEVFSGVSLYPNPSEGIVFITSDVTEAFDYVITDAKGAVIAKANAAIKGAQTNKIDLSNAETGVYFISLSNAQAQKVFRVVIQ